MQSTFQISYRLMHGELEETHSEYLIADNETAALKKFCRMNNIQTKNFRRVSEWEWEDGLWTGYFKSIAEVKQISCPHCNGKGVIPFLLETKKLKLQEVIRRK